jgi:cell filamentation protein
VAWRFDSWPSYFYPETFDPATGQGTLRNLYDERDARVLARLEYIDTSGRARQIDAGAAQIARTYDGEHLRAIHRYLFQDVYEWAGEYRTVNIAKGVGRGFGDIHTGEMQRYLTDAQYLITSTRWATLDRPEFVERSATVFAYVNQAHPFREGNGRASKVFMKHVAEQTRYTFDYARLSPGAWNQGSALSGPDLHSYAPDPTSLLSVFDAAAVDRAPGGGAGSQDTRVRPQPPDRPVMSPFALGPAGPKLGLSAAGTAHRRRCSRRGRMGL